MLMRFNLNCSRVSIVFVATEEGWTILLSQLYIYRTSRRARSTV
jgi:hypothetical protein